MKPVVLVLSALLLLASCTSVPLSPFAVDEGDTLRVLSYNVRFADAQTGPDGIASHASAVAAVVTAAAPDLVAMQEVVTVDFPSVVTPCPLRVALSEHLSDYGWVAPVGAAQLAHSNPILYRLDRLLPVRQGIEWFSPNPEIPDSLGWGNTVPRYVSWALFYDAGTKSHIYVLNVHLDHLSRPMNERAIARLIELLDTVFLDHAVILCGDFNEPASGRLRRALAERLDPALELRDGPTHTLPLALQIDGVYVSNDMDVVNAGVCRRDELTDRTSDHWPIIVDLQRED